jgi:hypothetical protein
MNTKPSKTDAAVNRIAQEGAAGVPAIVQALAPLDRGGSPQWCSATLDAWKMAVSRVRKAVAIKLGADHPAVPLCALPTEVYAESNALAQQQGIAKRRSLRGVHGQALLRTARAIVRDQDAGAYELLAALCLLTGRRVNEVASRGTIETVAPASQRVMLFSGQLKKRGEPFPPYNIAVLADPRIIAAGWARCQAALADTKPQTIIARTIEWSHDTFADVDGQGLQTRELRAVYAALILKNKPQSVTVTTWLASQLGHSPDDDFTALGYLGQFYDADEPETRLQTQRRVHAIKSHARKAAAAREAAVDASSSSGPNAGAAAIDVAADVTIGNAGTAPGPTSRSKAPAKRSTARSKTSTPAGDVAKIPTKALTALRTRWETSGRAASRAREHSAAYGFAIGCNAAAEMLPRCTTIDALRELVATLRSQAADDETHAATVDAKWKPRWNGHARAYRSCALELEQLLAGDAGTRASSGPGPTSTRSTSTRPRDLARQVLHPFKTTPNKTTCNTCGLPQSTRTTFPHQAPPARAAATSRSKTPAKSGATIDVMAALQRTLTIATGDELAARRRRRRASTAAPAPAASSSPTSIASRRRKNKR